MRYEISEGTYNSYKTYILKDHHKQMEAELLPSVGNNVIRFEGSKQALLSPLPPLADLSNSFTSFQYGNAILFPPNRVKNARFTFKDREYQLLQNEHPNHLHGELCIKEWKVIEHGVDPEEGCFITSQFLIQEHSDIMSYFPHPIEFTMTYSLGNGRLRATGEVKNGGEEEAPFAFGFHPYFPLPEQKETVVLTVPAKEEWPVSTEAFVQGLPEQTDFCQALKNGVTTDQFHDLFCSLVTLNTAGPAKCELFYKKEGLRLCYELDPQQFPYLVIFKPDWASSLSLEPYTYVTDAFNLPWSGELTGARGLKAGESFHFNWSMSIEQESV